MNNPLSIYVAATRQNDGKTTTALGLLEAFSIAVLPLAYIDAVSIAVLLVILFFRPSGLFGNRETSALKEF